MTGRILFIDLLAGRGFLKPATGHRRHLIILPSSLFSLVWDGSLRGRNVRFRRRGTSAVDIRPLRRATGTKE
jgi:hypothetical protein